MSILMDERIPNMVARLEAGETLQDIADDYGISRERVRQLTTGRYDRAKQLAARQEATLQFVDLYKEEILEAWLDGKHPLDVARELGLPMGIVERRVKEWSQELDSLEILRRKRQVYSIGENKITDEEIVSILQFIAEQEGHAPSITDYNRWRSQFPAWPSTALMSHGGRSFNDLVRQAGFVPNERPSGMGLRTFDDTDIFSAIRVVCDIVGHLPSMGEYDKNKPDGSITAIGIRRRFGSWIDALEAFINYDQ